MEKRSIYFPMRHIEFTPRSIDLDFEDITFRAADGIELNGWFIPASKRSPAVLFCHGNAGNISHRLEHIGIFHALDLSVFIFDYRGYGKSRGSPSETGTCLDAVAAFDYLKKRTEETKNAVVVYGESLGGAVAIDLAGKRAADALIVEGTFASVPEMASHIYPFLPIAPFIGIRYDSLSKVNKIRAPKLFIHSRDDEIVPFEQGRRLYEAAVGEKTFLEMRGGHNDAVIQAKEMYISTIARFLTEHNIISGKEGD